MEILKPDDPGRRLATHHLAGQVHIAPLQIWPGKDVPHRPGVVENLRPLWPHHHPQVGPLCARLRVGKVHPTPVEAGIRLRHIADLQRGRNELRVEAHPILAEKLFVDPVKNGDTWLLLLLLSAHDEVLVGARINAVDGRALAAQAVLLVPQQEGDPVLGVVVADVAGQQRRLPALVRDFQHLEQEIDGFE